MPPTSANPDLRLIRRLLRKALPVSIGSVLIPALGMRLSGRVWSLRVRNEAWRQVFDLYAIGPCQELATELGLQLETITEADPYSQESGPPPDKQLPLLQAPRPSLENFLADPGNQFAHATCRAISEAPGVLHNPLFIYGPRGVGKSHLLHAVAHSLAEQAGAEAVFSCSGSDFVRTVVPELHQNPDDSPLRRQIDQASLFAIDGMEALSERQIAQEELYLLINRALELGQQLLFTARHAPKRIPQLEERVSSRLAWGMSISIDPPVMETQLRFLRQLAGNSALQRNDSELSHQLSIHGGNMHQVLELARHLQDGSSAGAQPTQTSFDRIISVAARAYGVRPGDVASKHRQRPFVMARQAALLLGRRLTKHSLVALGGMVGGRDHSTVLHSLHIAEERLATDPDYAQLIAQLSAEVSETKTGS
ncbi:MAG: AAA family ATPase [Planctomycetota bacterium]|nr:MAG: AAA family ATPase [Planctomycetota bacterium]